MSIADKTILITGAKLGHRAGGAGPLDPRTSSRGGTSTVSPGVSGRSMRASSMRAARWPSSNAVASTLVSHSARRRAKTELSKPTRDSSSGTLTPRAAAADRAPTQVRSLAAKMAVGRSWPLSRRTVAR